MTFCGPLCLLIRHLWQNENMSNKTKLAIFIPIILIMLVPTYMQFSGYAAERNASIYDSCLESRNNTGMDNLTNEQGLVLLSACKNKANFDSTVPWVPAILLSLVWAYFSYVYVQSYIETYWEGTDTSTDVKKMLKNKGHKKAKLTVNNERQVIDTDEDESESRAYNDGWFRYENCLDIIKREHISKGDISAFFVNLGNGFKDPDDNYYMATEYDVIDALNWVVNNMHEIYPEEKEKQTREKKTKQLNKLINDLKDIYAIED